MSVDDHNACGSPGRVGGAVPAGASSLELGCGTGPILRPLAELGHPVLDVDESPAVLARIRSGEGPGRSTGMRRVSTS
ncbi:methyltransferase domain-containing protein [Herbidospora cretacea]|uniref:methyltransferase domain-containing protein n=1 Tax=Herbidospora cretacea TaxID=28444 RepID=UPI0012F9F0C2|nr:methyltransferase domain-containing protein [Herbidospora cretacea]